MPTNVILKNKDAEEIHTGKPWGTFFDASGQHELLIIEDYVRAHSVFKTVSLTSAGTVNIFTPLGEGSLVLADVVFSATKVQSSTLELLFDDGTNTETIFKASVSNQPIGFASWPAKGRVQSWRDAKLDLTTVNNTNVFMTCVYMKLPNSLTYTEWTNLR